MKKLVFIIGLALLLSSFYKKSYFQKTLESQKWKAWYTFDEMGLGNEELHNLMSNELVYDTLIPNYTVWDFKEGELEIVKYSEMQPSDTFHYQYILNTKQELLITSVKPESVIWQYSTAIVSSGSFIQLTRKD
jgi:hypothetical protein